MFSYGPRQGIYQPMESFRSPNWRASQSQTTAGKVYRCSYIISPPNSFPARSLVKRQVLSPHSQVPSEPPARHAPTTPPHSKPLSRPASARLHTSNSPPSPVKRNFVFTPSSSKSKRAYPTSLSTGTVQMHPRPVGSIYSISKEKYHRTCTVDFPYPDPVISREQSPFGRRLVQLTELESETVKQETFSHLSYRTTNNSNSSVMRASTATGGRGGVERTASREGRAKSARTSRRIDRKAPGYGRGNTSAKATRISSHADGDYPGTQSLFNLCTPSSASDLQLDMGSLSLAGKAGMMGKGVAAGGKEPPRRTVSTTKYRKKKGYLSESVSSCSIGRGRSKSASKRPRTAKK